MCFWGQVAARTLGDLVRKLGEKILPEIIPILEDGLRSDKSDERQGVCIGLSEIMKSTSRDAVSHMCRVKFPFSQVLMLWCRHCTSDRKLQLVLDLFCGLKSGLVTNTELLLRQIV